MLLTKKSQSHGGHDAPRSQFVHSLRRGLSQALPTMDRRAFLRRSGMGVGVGLAASQLSLVKKAQAAGGASDPRTRLHGDPEATYGQLDYFKGSTFLRTIEAAVGRERWDAYLRSYFDRHAFQPQTTAGFLADLRRNLIKGDASLEARLQLDRWAYQPGLPDNAVHNKSPILAEVDLAAAAVDGGGMLTKADVAKWSTQEWLRFLNGLSRKQTPARLAALDSSLDLSRSTNAYVRSAWLELAIANRYEPALPSTEQFLTSVGRGLLVYPIYRRLTEQGDWGVPIARAMFEKARPTYHPVTVEGVEKILKKAKA